MTLATCALVTQRRRRCVDRVRNEDRWGLEYGWGKGAKNDDVCTALHASPSLSLHECSYMSAEGSRNHVLRARGHLQRREREFPKASGRQA